MRDAATAMEVHITPNKIPEERRKKKTMPDHFFGRSWIPRHSLSSHLEMFLMQPLPEGIHCLVITDHMQGCDEPYRQLGYQVHAFYNIQTELEYILKGFCSWISEAKCIQSWVRQSQESDAQSQSCLRVKCINHHMWPFRVHVEIENTSRTCSRYSSSGCEHPQNLINHARCLFLNNHLKIWAQTRSFC